MFKNFKISPDERKLFAKPYSSDFDKNNLKGMVKTVFAVELKDSSKSALQFMPFAQKPLIEISDFNTKGEMLSYREVYEGNVPFLRKEYLYDDNGNLSEELIYDENENVVETVTFKHNSNGLMIEEFRKNYDITINAFYNEKNQLEKVKDKSELQGYGEKIYQINRNPGDIGNISEIKMFQNGTFSQVSKYEYDDRGNVIKVEHINSNDDPISSEILNYDKNNNIVNLVSKNKRRTTEYSYEYKYDQTENWINSKFYVNGDFSIETRREIQYY